MPRDTVLIVPYCQTWPDEFRTVAAEIRGALGAAALRIDHIGSTSVPGLCSKDIIDIQVTVADLYDDRLVQAMSAAGLVLRPQIFYDHVPPGYDANNSAWEKRYFREAEGRRMMHVHVRAAGKPNQRYAILFRDYLRAHPAAAAAYGQIKERLAPNLERLHYVDAKDPVCDLIVQSAEVWAGPNWRPGPSDG